MNGSNPLVTVVIPTHNRRHLLKEALHSVFMQSYPAIEVIIIDDAEDRFAESLARDLNVDKNVSRLIEYVYRSEFYSEIRGPQVCRNIGVNKASGEFVLFLDDDDLLAPNCIEQRMLTLVADPQLDFCVGQCRSFEVTPKDSDLLWAEWHDEQDDLCEFLANRIPWQTTGPLWRKDAIIRFGGWNETLEAGHDYEIHVRALASGARYVRLPTVDYFWRKPRADSYSSFERFKILHLEGALINAYIASISAVDLAQAWDSNRRKVARIEAIRLALTCRLFGGAGVTGRRALAAAIKYCGYGGTTLLEAMLCNRLWFGICGWIPALSWASRRKLVKN